MKLILILSTIVLLVYFFFFFQAEDGIRDTSVTGVQTCALPIFAYDGWMKQRRRKAFVSAGAAAVTDYEHHFAGLSPARWLALFIATGIGLRSEERRVGKEWRSRRWAER